MREGRLLTRRWVWITVAVLVVCAVGIAYLVYPRPPQLATVTVQQKTLQNKIFASGTVKPTNRQLLMPDQLPAPISNIRVVLGQQVHTGDTLIECDNETQSAALRAAKSTVQQATNTLDATRTQANSAPPGFQSQFTGTLASQESALAQAQAQLTQAQAMYDATIVKAKLSGTVVLLNPDGIGSDGNPAPIVEVVGPGRQLVTNVSEVDAVHIQEGMRADVSSDAFPNQQWTATVSHVAEFAVSGASGAGQVEVDLKPAGNFQVPFGFQVDIHIITATKNAVPVIPYAAVVQSGNDYAVYVVRSGRVHKTPVSLGVTSDTDVEVTKGLSLGDVVVVNPPDTLQDNESVRTHD